MSNLAVLSLKNRALIALITIVAAVFGGLALTSLKQELIPSIEFPALVVVSTYPGASPEVVNNDVSGPIEQAIQGVPGLETTTATSTTNSSIVQASFTYGTDLATAEQKMTQAINRISSRLPSGVEPNVISASIDDFPVIQVAVTGYSDAQTIQAQLQSNVIPKLEDIHGVNAAQIVGGTGQRVTITPDPANLAAAGFTQQAIHDALDQNGVLFPGGTITENDQTLTVQTGEKLSSVDQITALPLVPSTPAQFGRSATTIGDVATVEQVPDPVTTISRVDGKPAITIAVTKLPSANTVDVSKAVRAALPDLEKSLDGASFTVVFDQAPYIQQSIESLATEGLLGLLFAVIVILVFLMSVRATLVTAISIPTSVLITFIGIQAFGFSLNILTLGALTIAIGRVVDDSIVVIENIKRHYVGDADKKASILRAVREVAMAITSSTITTVAVFLPIAFVGDITGELFRPFALTVTIAMTASLLVALTIVPVLAYWFLRPGKPLLDAEGRQVDPEAWDAPPSRLQKSYLPILRWTLRHSWVTLGLAALVLVGTIAAAPFMKTNFLGDSGQNTFTITQQIGPAPSLDAEDAAAQQVEGALQGIDGIQTVQVSIGSSGSALRDAFRGGGSGITYSVTTDPNADQVKLRADVEAALADLDSAGTITVAASGGGFGSSDITIDVTAPDSDTLKTATDAVVNAVSGAEGIGQVSSNLSASLPYIAVTVDRGKAAALGLSEVAVGAIVSNTMQPQGIGSVEIGDTKLTVYLASSSTPMTVDELKDLPVPSATGPIPLSQVATVEHSQGPTSITTQDGKRTATVTASPSTDNLQTASAAVSTALKGADLPASASASVGGVVSQQSDAFGQLGLALLAAILIVYIVMVATFKSLRQPLLLLVSVPFAATGAILLQIITGVPLGVASLIGVLMLIGIVVTNAIVLVDLVNQYRGRGLSAHDATIAGGGRRLRPILMTALATIFALTPMALGVTGHGGFISQPLAIVVIGGLISSTVLTLLVLPTLYNLVEGAKERRAARRAAKTDAVTPVMEPEPALVGAGAVAAASGAPLTRRERRALEAGGVATGASVGSDPQSEHEDPAEPETPEASEAPGEPEPAPAAPPEASAGETEPEPELAEPEASAESEPQPELEPAEPEAEPGAPAEAEQREAEPVAEAEHVSEPFGNAEHQPVEPAEAAEPERQAESASDSEPAESAAHDSTTYEEEWTAPELDDSVEEPAQSDELNRSDGQPEQSDEPNQSDRQPEQPAESAEERHDSDGHADSSEQNG